MPIKVRLLHTRYPHWGGHSGFHQVARHLDPAACAATLDGVSDSDADWPLAWAGLNGRIKARIARRGVAWYKLSDLAAELRALPACLLNTTDVVHYLDGEHSAQYLPALVKRWRVSRVKTVASFHQPPELLDGLINREIVSRLDAVVLVSPTQEPYFRRLLPAERVRVVLHGVDTDFFRPAPAAAPRTTFKCMTVGHWLRDWDAVRAVVSKLARDRSIEFHVLTDRPTGLDDLPNVVFHRNVDDDTLCRLYQESDVLFLPLTQSTANNSLLEGMACGLPVISTRLASVAAYVDERAGILIDRNDADELVDAIVHLVRNPDRRSDLARGARRRAEALGWPHAARQLQALYAELVGGTRVPA